MSRYILDTDSLSLYERGHPALLSAFLACHAESTAQVILADPGRTRCGQFSTKMNAEGYRRTEQRLNFTGAETSSRRGRIMSFTRSHT